MPVLDCPCDPVNGPIRSATDGALGLTPAAAIRNARRDAIEEADDLVIEEIEDEYECKTGCRLVMGPLLVVGFFRQKAPPKRAWWTLFIAFWVEGTVSVGRSVQCVRKGPEDD